jgi:hypothetical protein
LFVIDDRQSEARKQKPEARRDNLLHSGFWLLASSPETGQARSQ